MKSTILALLTLSILTLSANAAGDNWGHDPDTSAWFKALKSPKGMPCCDYADGNRVEDPDYIENPDGSYEVNVPSHGGWKHVDKDRVVDGTNRVGYAIIWWSKYAPDPYCFLPGARG